MSSSRWRLEHASHFAFSPLSRAITAVFCVFFCRIAGVLSRAAFDIAVSVIYGRRVVRVAAAAAQSVNC